MTWPFRETTTTRKFITTVDLTLESSLLYVLQVIKKIGQLETAFMASNRDISIGGKEISFTGLFNFLIRTGKDPIWISLEEILAIKVADPKVIYVLPRFSDQDAFFNHLSKLNCKVLELRFEAMSGGECSSVASILPSFQPLIREEKSKVIKFMSGRVSGELDQSVTHLVAEICDPASEKYMAARSLQLPVMKIDWIDDAWKACNSHNFVDMKSKELIDKYKLPIFTGCVITISGFSGAERTNIGRLVELNGGQYTAQMRKNTCTHLISASNSGDKYSRALEWGNVKVVDLKWLKSCVETGYRLPEGKFGLRREHSLMSAPSSISKNNITLRSSKSSEVASRNPAIAESVEGIEVQEKIGSPVMNWGEDEMQLLK
uniref:BRCT domain-containing protein n=1 Tax=Ditylenchus dipsaci TaxID=166011 RepID=A0A915D4V6_9BILA